MASQTTSREVFKTIFVPSQLEEAVLNQLHMWFPTYIRQVEEQLGLPIGNIPAPGFYSNRNSFDYLAGEKMPKVVAISPGLYTDPTANGSGQYSTWWRLGVGVVAVAKDEPIANMLVKIYGMAAVAIMLHKQDLGGISNGIEWIGATFDDVPVDVPNQLTKLFAGDFAVQINDTVTKWAGPDLPDQDPYAWGIVEQVIIEIERKDIA